MQIRLFTIPNMLTLGNLLCGSCAAITLLTSADFKLAFWLVVVAAVFDFFDGFAARLLKSVSPIGVQLDSLADMVSFGLVPSLAMWSMYESAPESGLLTADVAGIARYATLIIVAFSALRLAKFNVDDTQTTEFCGLPTPANGLFCLSLGMLAAAGDLVLCKEVVLAVSVVMAVLLISPIRMFALKFKGFGWRGNELRYSFLLASALIIVLFTRYSIPAIIIIYVTLSSIRWVANKNKR
ncbi:MAG: CDP-alcohol phosphatidyltransferase family protein [Alistipes sp.]|nr:CDP-alcohol phosphatidyltransferase family protein [Alistipes sp.]